jgi:hypothetical protein
LEIWTQRTGYDLGVYAESTQLEITLPTLTNIDGVDFSLISGTIPPGLWLDDNKILGTPREVIQNTEFNFCIRARKNNSISDRTFKITVIGPDIPEFETPEGLLPVGANDSFFIIDSSFVDFTLQARDSDVAAGQQLRFSILEGDGALPPGLTLSLDGRISGFVDALAIVPVNDRSGSYDSKFYDSYGYDYAIRPDNGYDTFSYDEAFYDYFVESKGLKKLNRNYEFIVTVTDGVSEVRRKFRIYVIGDDYLRADNSLLQIGNGSYTADNTYLRSPVWTTNNDLGMYRANNYVTIFLDIYDAEIFGPVIYELADTNPGTYQLKTTGEVITNGRYDISGQLPYFPKSKIQATNQNQWVTLVEETASILPPNLYLDRRNGEVFGVVPYQTAILKEYTFTINAYRLGIGGERADSEKTFRISIVGEVDSNMQWITGSDLGSIDANFVSNLKIEAASSVPRPKIEYSLILGFLPPGLTLQPNGEITGKVRQFSAEELSGLTTFFDTGGDNQFFNQQFDNGATVFDREFRFIVRAKDQFNYSAIDREFFLKIGTPNDRLYSNIYVEPMMDLTKRQLFNRFIGDGLVFPPDKIYRSMDPNFGLQTKPRLLVYAGIETEDAAKYISAMGTNHKNKKFLFGDVKSARAVISGTKTPVYEVIYVEIIDPMEVDGQYLPQVLKLSPESKKITADLSNGLWANPYNTDLINKDEPFLPRPWTSIKTDQTDISVSDPNITKRYPSSISIWRDRIRTVGLTERNFLPLWMRTRQEDIRQELDFVLALPLCYCKPGSAKEILLNIKNYMKVNDFSFNQLDFTVDRYIIDSVNGFGSDKYLIFNNNRASI